MSKEQIDLLFSKWISRKLMVFIISCFGLFTGYVSSEHWVILATAYVSIQGFTEIVKKVKL